MVFAVTYCIGLDLGSAEGGDYTCLSVLEHYDNDDEGKPKFVLRWLDRWNSLLPVESIKRLSQVIARPPLLYNADVAIDARGAGWYIASELERLQLGNVRRIMSTAGAEENTKLPVHLQRPAHWSERPKSGPQ